MDQDRAVSRPRTYGWETPGFEEIGVSAEATAYAGIWNDWPWD